MTSGPSRGPAGICDSGPRPPIAASICASTGGTICAPSPSVELVAVVGRRVVARRDHDARRGRQVPDRERQQRRRVRPRQQVNADPRPREHGRRLVSEGGRPVPRVTSDDHCHPRRRPARRQRSDAGTRRRGSTSRSGTGRLDSVGRRESTGTVLAQPPGQRRRRRPDHRPVHPVRPRSHLAAQPRRAEPQAAGEPVGEPGHCRPPRLAPLLAGGEQCAQFGLVTGIRILADPGLHLGAQAVGDHGVAAAAGRCDPAGQVMRARHVRQIGLTGVRPAAGCRRAGRLSGPPPPRRPR